MILMTKWFRLALLPMLLLAHGCSDKEQQATVAPSPVAEAPVAVVDVALAEEPSVATDEPAAVSTEMHYAPFTQLPATTQWVTLRRGQTVSSLLSKQGFSGLEIARLASALEDVIALNKLQAGSVLAVNTQDGQRQVSLAGEYAERIDAVWTDAQWQVTTAVVPTRIEVSEHAVVIDHSLYGDAANAGVPGDVINGALLALSHFIDFQRQVYEGNRFEVAFERTLVIEDEPLFAHMQTPLQATYLRFVNSEDDYRLYRYQDAFYLEDGRLAESFLLKTPLNGARLSSHYGQRKHPLLGYTRMHKGIDFSAPEGTPIMAAGSGTVKRANAYGSYGNAVVLQHDNGYETLYAHLRGFADGIEAGTTVKQGDIIGFLGNTGLSQARHLHYEVYKDGKSINPLQLKKLSTDRLDGALLADFEAHVLGLEERTLRLASFASGDSSTYPPERLPSIGR
ncbi:M23 family peptidase [Pseudidiomarina sediminum]|uniref:M23 family peptidase n=2 Tax=Pseudidiomarina sediminum TaxID=431675 RepID=A0A432ZAH0_9GAMM|nr:M23 family peptidase [Pseudidiomarina sediminum]